jgi:glutaminyl-peptide cyclotransferase
MVGGRNMKLNIDYNSLISKTSGSTLQMIFSIGRRMKYPCFFENRLNAIVGDHTPFIRQMIPSIILIDIDYPQWHTHDDTLGACSQESIFYLGDVLYRFCSQEYLLYFTYDEFHKFDLFQKV